MATVEIEDDVLLDILMERVNWWLNDGDTEGYNLFRQMYERRISEGRLYMDNGVQALVDNDYVNCTFRCWPGSKEYRKYKRLYDKAGKQLPVALDDDRTIEAECNGVFLVSC